MAEASKAAILENAIKQCHIYILCETYKNILENITQTHIIRKELLEAETLQKEAHISSPEITTKITRIEQQLLNLTNVYQQPLYKVSQALRNIRKAHYGTSLYLPLKAYEIEAIQTQALQSPDLTAFHQQQLQFERLLATYLHLQLQTQFLVRKGFSLRRIPEDLKSIIGSETILPEVRAYENVFREKIGAFNLTELLVISKAHQELVKEIQYLTATHHLHITPAQNKLLTILNLQTSLVSAYGGIIENRHDVFDKTWQKNKEIIENAIIDYDNLNFPQLFLSAHPQKTYQLYHNAETSIWGNIIEKTLIECHYVKEYSDFSGAMFQDGLAHLTEQQTQSRHFLSALKEYTPANHNPPPYKTFYADMYLAPNEVVDLQQLLTKDILFVAQSEFDVSKNYEFSFALSATESNNQTVLYKTFGDYYHPIPTLNKTFYSSGIYYNERDKLIMTKPGPIPRLVAHLPRLKLVAPSKTDLAKSLNRHSFAINVQYDINQDNQPDFGIGIHIHTLSLLAARQTSIANKNLASIK